MSRSCLIALLLLTLVGVNLGSPIPDDVQSSLSIADLLTQRQNELAASRNYQQVKEEFFAACGTGDLEGVKRSVSKVKGGVQAMLEWHNKWRNPGMHVAAWRGHTEVVNYLLSQGWPVDQKGREEATPLDWAAKGGHLDTSQALIQAGAKVTARDELGNEPVHWAAEEGHVQVVDMLVKEGAGVEVKGWKGRTPLHLASMYGHRELVKFLLSKGADPGVKDDDGQTPLDLTIKEQESSDQPEIKAAFLRACTEGNLDEVKEAVSRSGGIGAALGWLNEWHNPGMHVAAWRGYLDVVTYLLEKGWPVDQPGRGGRTPLFWAAKGGHLATCKVLIQKGAKVGARDDFGDQPVHWAVEGGQLPALDLLLGEGSEVNSVGWKGRTPLHLAAKDGRADLVQLLVSKGGDPGVKDAEGHTPVDVAKETGKRDVLAILEVRSSQF